MTFMQQSTEPASPLASHPSQVWKTGYIIIIIFFLLPNTRFWCIHAGVKRIQRCHHTQPPSLNPRLSPSTGHFSGTVAMVNMAPTQSMCLPYAGACPVHVPCTTLVAATDETNFAKNRCIVGDIKQAFLKLLKRGQAESHNITTPTLLDIFWCLPMYTQPQVNG